MVYSISPEDARILLFAFLMLPTWHILIIPFFFYKKYAYNLQPSLFQKYFSLLKNQDSSALAQPQDFSDDEGGRRQGG